MTYQSFLQTIRKQLQDFEVENATLECHELLCHCAGLKKAELFRDLAEELPQEVEEKVSALVARRLKNEPLAYLLHQWDFYGLTLKVTPDVLIPRIDTEILAQRGIQLAAQSGGKVLDLCAGSGCIGLAIGKSIPTIEVVLGEISPPALEICLENIQSTGLGDRVSCQRMDCLQPPGEWLQDQFSLVVCNPPYIPTEDVAKLQPMVKDFEPNLALDGGADGLNYYRNIISHWKEVVKTGGYLLFEVGIHQCLMVESLMEGAGFQTLESIPDTQRIMRVVQGKKM